MGELSRKYTAFVVALVWIPMAALAVFALRKFGWWPHTWVAWLVSIVVGPVLVGLPYALANNVMGRLESFTARRWPVVPGRRFDARRVVFGVGVGMLMLPAAFGVYWVFAHPVATALRPLAPIAQHHFERVR
ncbi:MAG TPA: hypothetical protein VJY35_03505 [Candidatus Eisenbacteria bacterium]|nr:hypothetical protein [Candidatus Eisenbacteria bacterium]